MIKMYSPIRYSRINFVTLAPYRCDITLAPFEEKKTRSLAKVLRALSILMLFTQKYVWLSEHNVFKKIICFSHLQIVLNFVFILTMTLFTGIHEMLHHFVDDLFVATTTIHLLKHDQLFSENHLLIVPLSWVEQFCIAQYAPSKQDL